MWEVFLWFCGAEWGRSGDRLNLEVQADEDEMISTR